MLMGADPELGILDPEGKSVPAHRFFPHKKEALWPNGHPPEEQNHLKPFPGAIYRDGWMLEIAAAVASCREVLVDRYRGLLREAALRLPPGFTLSTAPTVEVDLSLLDGAPEDMLMFGCEPSRDAYTGQEKYLNLDARSFPLRTAGGHMHFSDPATQGHYVKVMRAPRPGAAAREDTIYKTSYQIRPIWQDLGWCQRKIKLMDLLVGVPLSLVTHRPEQYTRRQFYGQAGEFRMQTYGPGLIGLEYRTPGPELFSHQALMSLFYGVGREVMQGRYDGLYDPKRDDDVRLAINEGIGLEALVQTVPKWYDLGVIQTLAKKRFFDLRLPKMASPGASGWSVFSRAWKIKRPATTISQELGTAFVGVGDDLRIAA